MVHRDEAARDKAAEAASKPQNASKDNAQDASKDHESSSGDKNNPNVMEARKEGKPGKGERGTTSQPEDPTKSVKPIRDKDGKVVGWRTRTADGKGKDKSLEWGKQQGLNPDDFAKRTQGPSAGSVVGGLAVVGAVACALAEPCGAAVATALGVGGTVLALSQ
jgi:hypothetical protein